MQNIEQEEQIELYKERAHYLVTRCLVMQNSVEHEFVILGPGGAPTQHLAS